MATETKKLQNEPYGADEYVLVPTVDIYETENEYVLKAEMPGVSREQLDVTLNENHLEINGGVGDELLKAEENGYGEYTLYNYHRRFLVGDGIDSNGITAGLENGILTIMLPKSERVKPKKIEVSFEK
jgi:HSP20 family protein